MAGLIAGRPTRARCVIPTEGPWETGDPVIPHIDDRVLPYAGINPFCNIVPVSTTAAPVPSMVLAALDYAQFIQADVVVIAAAWEDSEIYTADLKHCPERWSQVDAKLKELARTAVVLCAAGNSGKTELAYPALLAKQAQIPNLLAVTACDAFGKVLDYAPRFDTAGQMVMALSSSSKTYDSAHILYDPWESAEPGVGRAQDDPLMTPEQKKALPLQGLISLDVPGPFGYNPSPYSYTPKPQGPHLEIGSLYCRFSGTSAATAVAAGLISLAMQIGPAASLSAPPSAAAGKPVTDMLTLKTAQALVGMLAKLA